MRKREHSPQERTRQAPSLATAERNHWGARGGEAAVGFGTPICYAPSGSTAWAEASASPDSEATITRGRNKGRFPRPGGSAVWTERGRPARGTSPTLVPNSWLATCFAEQRLPVENKGLSVSKRFPDDLDGSAPPGAGSRTRLHGDAPAAPGREPMGDLNRLRAGDLGAHQWYRFVLSFPPHLVRDYLQRFNLGARHCVLDPFCGTGTTLVECKKCGVPSVGLEAHPMAHFATLVKIDWSPDADGLWKHARSVARAAKRVLDSQGYSDDGPLFSKVRDGNHGVPPELRTLPAEQWSLLLRGSISPLPLHKTLVLLDTLRGMEHPRYLRHELLVLAKALVTSTANLHFGPEVGVGPPKEDAAVVDTWLACVREMVGDLRQLRQLDGATAQVFQGDARRLRDILQPASIDAVITSPPYPNEKDYTRTTRLESVLLGFLKDRTALRELKQSLLRSNTRNVYKGDDDDRWVAAHPVIQRIADAIEARRLELRKDSGFERLYARVTKLYFGGMARHFAALRPLLRPGARLAYVVGDQASYLRVMIRTGQLLGEIAESLGYEVTGIDLFRTRLSTATREYLREEVLLLRWNG